MLQTIGGLQTQNPGEDSTLVDFNPAFLYGRKSNGKRVSAMKAAFRFEPGSVPLLILLALVSFPIALVWTWWGYKHAHVERQGIDIVNHAILVHQNAVSDGDNERILAFHLNYPQTSHRLAAWFLPLFEGDVFLAMRFVALLSLLGLFFCQLTLLCRFLPAVISVMVLLAWQWVCLECKVSNLNHFMWDGQYNYSRSVGGVGLWLALVLVTTTTKAGWQRCAVFTLAIAAVLFSFACHLAPGAIAVAFLAVFGSILWLRNRQWEYLFLMAGTVTGSLVLFFATQVWLYMAANATMDGWMPVKHWWLLLLWIPTFLVVAGWLGRIVLKGIFISLHKTQQKVEAAEPTSPGLVTLGVSCALLAAGGFQFYLMGEWWAGSCAPYAVKSLFFYTFPLATFLWIVGFTWVWKTRQAVTPDWLNNKFMRWLAVGFACVLCFLFVQRWLRRDPGLLWAIELTPQQRVFHPQGYFQPDPAWMPMALTDTLAAYRDDEGRWCYFDPLQPSGSHYASVIGLQTQRIPAVHCFYDLTQGKGAALVKSAELQGVLLPYFVDPANIFPPSVRVEKTGPFWRCSFPVSRTRPNSYQKTTEIIEVTE